MHISHQQTLLMTRPLLLLLLPRLAWCRTPKVATTTWARIVLQLYGVKKFGEGRGLVARM